MRRRSAFQSYVLFSLAAAGGLGGGCERYTSMPLNKATVEQRLTPPSADTLRVQAQSIRHPLLRPVEIDPEAGLTPDGAAIVAVLANPALRADRNRRSLARAQLLQAGLLPNPQFGYSTDFDIGTNPPGTVRAYSIGANWDVTSLITHDAKVRAAEANARAIDLDVAWVEWQTAQAARLAAFDVLALRAQVERARESDRLLAENARAVRAAMERHQDTVLNVAAAESASQDAHATLLIAQRDLSHAQLVLTRALGLPPETPVRLRDVPLPSRLDLPSQAQLLEGIEDRRLDLLGLKQGYQSEDENFRLAILGQFPKINLGGNRAKDNTGVKSIGLTMTIDIPIFDRNQGNIAIERATRQKLFDEYVQRLFESRADIASSLDDIRAITGQIAAAEEAVPSLRRLVETYGAELGRGNVDVLSYYAARNNLELRELGLLRLKQQLADTRVALEIAAGQYLPDPAVAATATSTAAATGTATVPSTMPVQ